MTRLARPAVDRRPDADAAAGARRGRSATLTLRLADSLVVQSVVSDRVRPAVQPARARTRTRIIVNLPATLLRDDRADADDRLRRPARAAGAGPRNASALQAQTAARSRRSTDDAAASRRSPASSTATGATGIRRRRSPTTPPPASRITVPARYDVRRQRRARRRIRRRSIAGDGSGAARARSIVFTATQPLRYLAFVVSRFVRADRRRSRSTIAATARRSRSPTSRHTTARSDVEANPRQAQPRPRAGRPRRRHRAVLRSR